MRESPDIILICCYFLEIYIYSSTCNLLILLKKFRSTVVHALCGHLFCTRQLAVYKTGGSIIQIFNKENLNLVYEESGRIRQVAVNSQGCIIQGQLYYKNNTYPHIFRKDCKKCIIDIKENGHLTITQDKKVYNIHLTNLHLMPKTCQGLQFTNDDCVQLRLGARATTKDTTENDNIQQEFLKITKEWNTNNSSQKDGNAKKILSSQCKKCKKDILAYHCFSRVLALPSDNWLSGCGDWFCHASPDSITSQALAVKPHDCLVGDTGIMMHTQNIEGKVKYSKSNTAICLRCRAVLGQRIQQGQGSESAVRLHSQAVDISSPSLSIYNKSLQSSISELFLHYNKEYNAFRFVIEANNKPVILIWLLEKECIVYQATLSSEDCQIEPVKSIKVLYNDGIRAKNKSLSQSWSDDLTVHTISLPLSLCYELLQNLINSTRALPSQNQLLNSFYVGLLKRSFP